MTDKSKTATTGNSDGEKVIGNELLTKNQFKKTYTEGNVKLELSITLEDHMFNQESTVNFITNRSNLLSFIAESSRNFYLETARKLNSKP